MPSFRPSMVVNFKLMFDESLHIVRLPDPVSVEDRLNNPGAATAPTAAEPLILQSGLSGVSHIAARVPIKASVELPGYRQAGQFSIDVAFKDLPIDPRTVRAASVEIHLGSVSAADFSAGMNGYNAQGGRASILATRDAAGLPRRDTLLMVGFVDEWSSDHDDTGSVVTVKGRDARGVLIETPIGAGVPGAANTLLGELDLARPINEVVVQILRFNPAFQQFNVIVNPTEWPGGVVPSPAPSTSAPRHRRGADGQRTGARSAPNGDSNSLTFWDAITRYCYLVGGIPYFTGLDLTIRPSRALFDQMNSGVDPAANPTPFAGGQRRSIDAASRARIDPPLSVRRLVYGRDTKKVSYERKFAGPQRPKVIRCISHDPSSGERGVAAIVQGRWPVEQSSPVQTAGNARAARRTRVAPGGQAAQEEILNVPVPGVRDPSQLQEIARSIYEELGRGELGGSVETKNLSSFGGDNADPDLLHLRPGDAVELLTDVRNLAQSSPLVSTLTDHLRNSFNEQVQAITARIGDENLARVIVATSRGAVQELQSFFRVANIHYSWASSRGVSIGFDFQNYVVSRNQLDPAQFATGRATSTPVPGVTRRINLGGAR